MRHELLATALLVIFAAFAVYEVGTTVSQNVNELSSKIELRR